MPLPLILGIGAAIAGAGGLGAGIHGGLKMKEANDTLKEAKIRNDKNIAVFERSNKATLASMDKLGKFELEIINSFESFAVVIEQIQNKPVFNKIDSKGVKIKTYTPEELKMYPLVPEFFWAGLEEQQPEQPVDLLLPVQPQQQLWH